MFVSDACQQARVRPYDSVDKQVLQTHWDKALRQFERQDWAACIARAAATAEMAANIYVRRLGRGKYALPAPVVAALIAAANGLEGIFRGLIRPTAERRGARSEMIHVQKRIESLSALAGVADSARAISRADAKSAVESSFAIIRAFAPRESVRLSLPF